MTMIVSSKYWKICKISLTNQGYQIKEVCNAKKFLQKIISDSPELDSKLSPLPISQDLVNCLFDSFKNTNFNSIQESALAGLCLRCYVSYPILNACKKLASQFGNHQFTYRELLPYVLDDDGENLIILENDSQNTDSSKHFKVDKKGISKTIVYQHFTINILETFDQKSSRHLSLYNWAYRLTQQHQELKQYLSEYGFQVHSDWSLINQVNEIHLDSLTEREQNLVRAFHAIYRRDRRTQARRSKCLPPSEDQLHEMMDFLHVHKVKIPSTQVLLKDLQNLAQQLQQYDFWRRRGTPVAEPLELKDEETGQYILRNDLHSPEVNTATRLETEEFLDDLQHQLTVALGHGIQKSLQERVSELESSRGYKDYACKFLPALKLYYFHDMTGKQIAEQLGFKNQSHVSRVLQPLAVLSRARLHTVHKLLQWVLEVTHHLDSIEPSYLDPLTQQLEAFVDQEIFQAAESEMQSGKSRTMTSPYAQQLRNTLGHCQEKDS